MRDTFAFGDAHGNHKAVKNLLKQEGLLSGNNVRLRDEVLVVSLGDLANCVIESRDDDLRCLNMVGPIIDKLILGNHESPYLNFPSFAGFFNYPEIKDRIRELLHSGQLIPCLVVGDILLTHAGVANKLGEPYKSAQSAEKGIRDAFMFGPKQPILHNCGHSRGGWDKEGSIFWSDWSEAKSMNYRQIIGHTVGDRLRSYYMGKSVDDIGGVPAYNGNGYNASFCIDLGCGKNSDTLAGVWIREGELTFVRSDG